MLSVSVQIAEEFFDRFFVAKVSRPGQLRLAGSQLPHEIGAYGRSRQLFAVLVAIELSDDCPDSLRRTFTLRNAFVHLGHALCSFAVGFTSRTAMLLAFRVAESSDQIFTAWYFN